MRNTFIDTVIEACEARDDIFIISGDAGFGVFDEFKNDHADRFLNLGIAEQNMTGFSAGLSMTGFKVYMYNIIPFVLYRNYEQVRNDICYQKLPVVLAGIGSGVTYAPQGMTHYSIEDIGLAQTLPNLTVISPMDPVEARLAALYSLNSEGPFYVRLAKRGEPKIHETEDFDITFPPTVRKGEDAAVLFHGSISSEVIKAYDELRKENIYPELISVPVIQPLNKHYLMDKLKDKRFVITVEEHFENSGLGGILRALHSEYKPQWRLKTMGIPYRYIHDIKTQQGMREYFGISCRDIENTVKKLLEN
ncbi:MAG: transketolase [Deferribacteres bacterium]|nr:transketolase [Deferribacteres bacterium]